LYYEHVDCSDPGVGDSPGARYNGSPHWLDDENDSKVEMVEKLSRSEQDPGLNPVLLGHLAWRSVTGIQSLGQSLGSSHWSVTGIQSLVSHWDPVTGQSLVESL
jgi:hypothetical protein